MRRLFRIGCGWHGRFPPYSIALALTVLATRAIRQVSPVLPLLLNLLWLFDPTVDLIRSRLIFAASLWLALLLGFFYHQETKQEMEQRSTWPTGFIPHSSFLIPLFSMAGSGSHLPADPGAHRWSGRYL